MKNTGVAILAGSADQDLVVWNPRNFSTFPNNRRRPQAAKCGETQLLVGNMIQGRAVQVSTLSHVYEQMELEMVIWVKVYMSGNRPAALTRLVGHLFSH